MRKAPRSTIGTCSRPYDSANFLNDGFDWIFDSGSITDLLRGVTVQHLARGKLVAYDAANRIISVTATLVAGTLTQGIGEDDPWRFKRQTDGSWRFFGNQRPGATSVDLAMRTDQNPGATPGTEIKVGPRQHLGVLFLPPANSMTSVTISGGPFSASPLGNGGPEIVTLQASPPPAPPLTYQRDVWGKGINGTATQATVFTFSATPASGPQNIFTTILGNRVTTDTAFALVQPDATQHALVNANLGSPLNVSWTNPTQFAVAFTRLGGSVFTASFQQCVLADSPITPGATSGSVTFPTTCMGEPTTSATINVNVRGPDREHGQINYTFSG